MTFFESLLALLAIAILLLQASRRLAIPYPTMLAASGVALAMLPGAPTIGLDPHTALALFIAPALVDAAFDFPLSDVRRYARPLFALAVLAVLFTAASVAWIGVAMAGLPLYAAVALGAIVAPPDAAAATAIFRNVKMPRRSIVVLKGESLLNDATALLLFSAAVAFHGDAMADRLLPVRLLIAVPGGVLLGIAAAFVVRRLMPLVTGTLGGNLLEFVFSFGLWILAERLQLSAVLCIVAFAVTLAGTAHLNTPARMRIHSFAVWDSAVFLLNVVAFLLMGLQARSIIGGMSPARLEQAAWFALVVVACVILVRMFWLIVYNRLAVWFRGLRGSLDPAPFRHGILIGWSGMRGIVTLATAFALPNDFPQRDLIVLTAFAVVIATLVIQGMTLVPLIRLLGLNNEDGLAQELGRARVRLADAALAYLGSEKGELAQHWRYSFEIGRAANAADADNAKLLEKRRLGLEAVRRQREALEELGLAGQVGADAFLILQEELDFTEVTLTNETERRIEEN